jgi:hypothetical protein
MVCPASRRCGLSSWFTRARVCQSTPYRRPIAASVSPGRTRCWVPTVGLRVVGVGGRPVVQPRSPKAHAISSQQTRSDRVVDVRPQASREDTTESVESRVPWVACATHGPALKRLMRVGARGFEPPTSCSRSRRAQPDCATPRPNETHEVVVPPPFFPQYTDTASRVQTCRPGRGERI